MVEESFNSGDSGRRWPRCGYVSRRKEQASAMGGANKSLAHGAGHYIFRQHLFSEKTRAHMPKPEIPVLRVGTANACRFAYDKHLHTISSLGGHQLAKKRDGSSGTRSGQCPPADTIRLSSSGRGVRQSWGRFQSLATWLGTMDNCRGSGAVAKHWPMKECPRHTSSLPG